MNIKIVVTDQRGIVVETLPLNHKGLLDKLHIQKLMALPDEAKHEALVALGKQFGKTFTSEDMFQLCRAILKT